MTYTLPGKHECGETIQSREEEVKRDPPVRKVCVALSCSQINLDTQAGKRHVMDEMQEPTTETDIQQNQNSKVECSQTDRQEATSSGGGVTTQAGEAECGDEGGPLKKKLKVSALTDSTSGSTSDERKSKPGSQPSSREPSADREESWEKKAKKTDSLQKMKDAARGNK